MSLVLTPGRAAKRLSLSTETLRYLYRHEGFPMYQLSPNRSRQGGGCGAPRGDGAAWEGCWSMIDVTVSQREYPIELFAAKLQLDRRRQRERMLREERAPWMLYRLVLSGQLGSRSELSVDRVSRWLLRQLRRVNGLAVADVSCRVEDNPATGRQILLVSVKSVRDDDGYLRGQYPQVKVGAAATVLSVAVIA